MDNNNSFLVCVDPFDISDTTSPVYDNTEEIFLNNIKISKHYDKILHKKQYSDDFFKENTQTFNFIYIDGSHLVEDIEKDFNNSLKIIENNGIIWMDDYASSEKVTNLIDSLYEKNKRRLNIIHKSYQIAFRVSE
jgi:predicted O-methyltransferase YrrM